MPTDMMLSVAAENRETKMNVIAEEQHLASLIKPFHIWISRWVSVKYSKKKIYILNIYTFSFPVLSAQPATS